MRLFKVGAEGKNELIPSKFIQDSEGRYWEERGRSDGRIQLAPAPMWAGNINFYLFEGPEIFIEPQRKPLCDVPALKRGAGATDGGNLLLTDEEKQAEEEENERKKSKFLGLIPGIGSVITFLLTEDMRNQMVLTDKWTILMLAILVIGAAMAYLTRNQKDEEEEQPEET